MSSGVAFGVTILLAAMGWNAIMKKRHVFLTPSVAVAEAVVRAVRGGGIQEDAIKLEARSDVEKRRISDKHKNASMDFIPAALRGTIGGAGAGFVAGLLAMWIPYFGLSLPGVGALTLIGALVGTWASVLIGSALPDDIRRTFAGEIEAGKVLVVVDAEQDDFGPVESAIAAAGGERLPYESTTALS